MTSSASAAARATAARDSGERSTTNRQRCALAPDGAQRAASRQRASVTSSTGSSVNRLIVRAVAMASHMSDVAPVTSGSLRHQRAVTVAWSSGGERGVHAPRVVDERFAAGLRDDVAEEHVVPGREVLRQLAGALRLEVFDLAHLV